MKLRLISLTSAVVMLLALAVGCAGNGTAGPTGGNTSLNENSAQLVVAINPILIYDDGETVIPYNDVKNAIKADFEGSTLTTMHQSTPYSWVCEDGEDWQKRAIYTLDNWTNGSGAEAKSAFSYGFNAEGTTSLASYYAQSVEVTPYSETDSVPDYGLLMSVTGNKEEALAYTIQKDGILNIAEGFITAVQSVAGVNTGFLAEDGVARSASFRVMINDTQIFSGTLCNSTAAPDGVAVTSLAYDQLSDLEVKAGNVLFIAVRLNAAANTDADQSAGEYNEEDNWTTVGTEVLVPVGKGDSGESDTVADESEALTVFDGFDSRFALVFSSEQLSGDMIKSAGYMRETMEYVLDTEVRMLNEDRDEEVYEIVLGPIESRPESEKIYNELLSARPNNGKDYIIRRMGTKVYIAASNGVSLKAAADYFIATFCTSEDAAVPADYNYVYRPAVFNATFAGVNVGNYVIRLEKYPTHMARRAAEQLQSWLQEESGYLIPIENLTDDGKHYSYEIQIGPMNGSVKLSRLYDTRFTNKTMVEDGKWSMTPSGYLTDQDPNYYIVKLSGNTLSINGGSDYALDAAVGALCERMAATHGLAAGYTLEGLYKTGDHSLSGGYDLVWQENFSYDTDRTDYAIAKEVTEYWTLSRDSNMKGPTVLGVDENGETIYDKLQMPAVYGENWWIWNDPATSNGYLVQVTKKESYGYACGRLISAQKWSFRYGIWETRIVVGTRNGACSAIWASTDNTVDAYQVRNEPDLYENFGKDMIVANYHTWAPDYLGGHINHNSKGHMLHTGLYPAEGEHFYDTFHSLSCEWTADGMAFFWDGEEFDFIDLTDKASGQASTSIKFACGTGTGTYARNYNPFDWMDEEYEKLTGKTVEDYFEVQCIDYSYIFQTSNEGKNSKQRSYMKYARTHPNYPRYQGYLSEIEGYVNAQLPQ